MEIPSVWRKSTYSGANNNCVEVVEGPETLVRDTQHRAAGHLAVPSAEWTALLNTVAAE